MTASTRASSAPAGDRRACPVDQAKRPEEADFERRRLAAGVHRLIEIAWTGHRPIRIISTLLVPLIVALATPGLWWALCAASTALGLGLEIFMRRWLARIDAQLSGLDLAATRAASKRVVLLTTIIMAVYCLPYIGLAFAPTPGPAVGFMFATGAALVAASQHVMTRNMIFFTIPFVALGLIANGAAMGGGHALLVGLVGATVTGNAIVLARGGSRSFGALVEAQLAAENNAAHLDARVRERTAELEAATQRAEEANRTKSMFIANMSHELRTPLNAIIGYSEIIQDDLADGNPTECHEHAQKVCSAATHLLGLINEVLDLSTIEVGKMDLKIETLSAAEVARQALDVVAPLAAKNNTTCDLVVTASEHAVCADPRRLHQCLINLLSNAAKFTHGGHVSLRVRHANVRGRDLIAFDVRDNGVGMSEETCKRLFQPFMQADQTETRQHQGAGLGLSITRRLARLMGGDVGVRSELGRGSAFTLYLPCRADASASLERSVA